MLATRGGKLTLALLCAIAFLDFVDSSIVNVALPSIRSDLGFSVQNLQWVVSGYMLTYGGLMLLGGRAADLFGRRRMLVAGTVLFGASSLAGGLAQSDTMLVAARLAQGCGAATMLPAALSLLTTTFTGPDRAKGLGIWGAMAGLASAAGVLLGGVLTEGPGWRAVLLVNPVACVIALVCVYRVFEDDRRAPDTSKLDVSGALLSTLGMLTLVYTLVKAPDVGWGATRTLAGLAIAIALLAAFVLNEARVKAPLAPLSIFRVKGLAAADITQLVAMAGTLSLFFFITIYMQNVLGYSQIKTGLAWLPLCAGVAISAGVTAQLIGRIGTRPVMISGALITALGLYLVSHLSADGSFAGDLLPGTLVASAGLGAVFVSVTTAANDGVPAQYSGLAASLLNAASQVGGALGLAVFSAIATARTDHLARAGDTPAQALTGGFQRAYLIAACVLVGAAVLASRTANTRSAGDPIALEPVEG